MVLGAGFGIRVACRTKSARPDAEEGAALHPQHHGRQSDEVLTMSTEKTRSEAREEKMHRSVELERAKDMERHKRETLNSLVREQVIHALHEPGDLLGVQVRPLWGTNYRVNVFAGVNILCARMIHSFFLVTDADGNILTSTPELKRR